MMSMAAFYGFAIQMTGILLRTYLVGLRDWAEWVPAMLMVVAIAATAPLIYPTTLTTIVGGAITFVMYLGYVALCRKFID